MVINGDKSMSNHDYVVPLEKWIIRFIMIILEE
jgi:hypothetical protein